MYHLPASKGDSLCPLGFHPQVRWPTRCKRCFRDYKEHYHKKKEEERSLKKDSIAASNPSISSKSKNDYPRSWASSDNLYEGKLENELTGYQSTLDLVHLDDNSSSVPTFNLRLPKRRNNNENQTTEKLPFDKGSDTDKNNDKEDRRIQIKEVKSVSNGPTNNDVQFVIQVKKKSEDSSSQEISENDESTNLKDTVMQLKKKLKETQEALEESKKQCDQLGKEKRDVILRRLPPIDKANKSNLEFNKLQQKYTELQKTFNNQKEENLNFQLEIKILKDELNRYPKERASYSVEELRSKLKSAETLCEELMDENESLKKDVRDMEEQIDEMQDNFREDQIAEYTSLKAELEQTTKNCRILSFKLRKAEKRNEQFENEKRDLEKQLKQLSENQINADRLKKIKKLEQELADSTSISTKLQIEVGLLNRKLFELESTKGDMKGPKTELQKISRQSLIRSGSQEEPITSQVSVPDTTEIERDLREQLKFSEEEAANLRQTITRIESDNEVLLLQLKKMTDRIRNKTGNVKDTIDDEELRMKLELNEQELPWKVLQNNAEKPVEKTQTPRPKKISEKTNKKLIEYEQQIKELKNDIDSEKSKNKQLREESNKTLKKWENESTELKNKFETLSKNNEQLNGTLETKEATIKTLEEKIEETIALKKAQKADLDKLKAELESRNNEVMAVKNQLNTIREQNDELKKKLKISQSEMKTSDDKHSDQIKKLGIDLENEKKKCDDLTKNLQVKNAEIQAMKLRLTKKSPEVDNKLQSKVDELNKLNNRITIDLDKATKKLEELAVQNETIQKDFSLEKTRIEGEKDALNSELQTIKQRLNNMIAEKREMQEEFDKERNSWFVEKSNIREASRNVYNSTEHNGLDRMRYDSLLAEKQSELDKYKKENESLSYQIDYMKKESDEIKSKLDDYEKVNKIQRIMSADATAMDREVEDLKKKLEMLEKSRKADILKCKMSYEQQMVTVHNEFKLLQSQIIRFKKEKDTYKSMLQSMQKSMGDLKYQREVATKVGSRSTKTDSLEAQVSRLEDELSEINLEYSKLKTQLVSDKSTYEVKILEMQTKINELEEEKILNSGKTKIAGRKTCMELSWQKEREEQQRLIQETTTLARDLRQTLFEVEKERDKERLEAKRKIEQMRNAIEGEQMEAKNKIKDLQCDLLELRDAHAKLRTTNERLKREKEKLRREESNIRSKSLSRTNINDSNDVHEILQNIDTLKCLAHEVEYLDDKQKGHNAEDDKRDKLNNIVSSLLNISQNLFSQTKEIEKEKLTIPQRRIKPDMNPENITKLNRQGSLKRRSLSLEQTSSFTKEQVFWQTDQGSMSSLRSANSDSNMNEMSDASVQSDLTEKKKKKKGLFGKLKKMSASKSVDEGDSGILSNILMGRKPSSLENLNNTITGIFRRGGSSSRSNSMERTKPPEHKHDSSSRQRPLMRMKSESPAR